ncbi:N-acetylglucosamine kinase [Alicyclobacillus fodiniaquatilis]|uniref:N-acetylglucosamine kinase n=1 Tax=Alicyclobacillus fodiniaquatilis TaxID=1661150 RepID=A0ABW4JBC9_9BACL
MALYVGIDGGGTSTRAFVFDPASMQGSVALGPASRQSSVGWETARTALVETLNRALAQMKQPANEVIGLSACLSGIDLPEQSVRMAQELQADFPLARIEVTNDSMAPLTAGTNGRSGAVLIGGTGTVAVGETLDGQVARAGGYGYLIGDEGSGFDIGRRGLMAAIQSCEGRGPNTCLWEAAQKVYDVTAAEQLIPVVYDADNPVAVMASFAASVLQLADEDEVAAAILEVASEAHMQLLQSVLQRLPEMDQRVVLSGSLFTKSEILLEKLRGRLPDVEITPIRLNAVTGALMRAMRLVDRTLLTRFDEGTWQGIEAAVMT